MKVECPSQGQVASVRQGGDDKSWRTSEVFISIFKHSIAVTDHAGMAIIIPLVTQLPEKKIVLIHIHVIAKSLSQKNETKKKSCEKNHVVLSTMLYKAVLTLVCDHSNESF